MSKASLTYTEVEEAYLLLLQTLNEIFLYSAHFFNFQDDLIVASCFSNPPPFTKTNDFLSGKQRKRDGSPITQFHTNMHFLKHITHFRKTKPTFLACCMCLHQSLLPIWFKPAKMGDILA